MEFTVTEIKALGVRDQVVSAFTKLPGHSLSLRLEGYEPCSSGGPLYTIHAVVPYSPEFGSIQIGQRFKFERIEDKVNHGFSNV
jgi:hypothetical protein